MQKEKQKLAELQAIAKRYGVKPVLVNKNDKIEIEPEELEEKLYSQKMKKAQVKAATQI